MAKCAYCGGEVPRRRGARRGSLFQSTSRSALLLRSNGRADEDEPVFPQRQEFIKEPVAQASLRHNWAPALAVGLTAAGFVFALLFPAFAFYTEWTRPAAGAFLVAIFGGAVVWYSQQDLFTSALFNTKDIIEDLIQRDIDGDGVVGAPAPPPERSGWLSIDGNRAQRSRQKSEAEEYREAVLRFVEIVWMRQNIGRRTGQKELRGHSLPHGYSVDDQMHREIGARLTAQGLAQASGKGWELIASPEEVAGCIEAWDPTAPPQVALPELPE